MEANQLHYPAGSKVRVKDICRNRKAGSAGLLPINAATWYDWVRTGRVPQGQLIGKNTRVWPIETVLAIGQGEGAAA